MASATSTIDGTSNVLATGTSGKPETKTEREYYVIAVGMVVAGGIVAWLCTSQGWHIGTPGKLASGMSVFALLYVAAQVIERILVPLAPLASTTTKPAATPAEAPGGSAPSGGRLDKATAQRAVQAWSVAAAAPVPSPDPADRDAKTPEDAAEEQATNLATWLELLNQAKKNGNTTLWALASLLGMVVSAATNIHLMRILVESWKWPTLDIIATGLVLGGGTKGLHDLIGNLQAKGDASGGTTGGGTGG